MLALATPSRQSPSAARTKMPEHTPKQSGHHTELPIERIVIDECLGPDSPLLAQLTARLGGHPVELVFLAARHPGIPDVEILDKLLDGRTALLTHDRVLHNLTIDRGLRSFIQSPDGGLTNRKLPDVAVRDKSLPVAKGGMRGSYVQDRAPDAQVIVGCLAGVLSGHQLKQFRTKRRRIRAHFGSADNIGATALTIGQRRTPRGIVGGYVLKVDARHGAKSLSPASEGYFLDPSGRGETLHALIWALTHVLMLQLEQRPLTLFLCDSDIARSCPALIAGHHTGRSSVESMAIRLLATAKQPQVHACVKGRFFYRMQAKLNQLTAHGSNELVRIDVQAMADAMEASNDIGVGLRNDIERRTAQQP